MKIEALITVISPSTFLSNITNDDVWSRDDVSNEEKRTIADISIQEVEFADVLLFLPSDDPSVDQSCLELLSRLNPGALTIKLPLQTPPAPPFDFTAVCKKGLFALDSTAEKAGWSKALDPPPHPEPSSSHPQPPPALIKAPSGCLTYRSRRPFHPHRFHKLIQSQILQQSGLGHIVRSRGIVWLAGGPCSDHCAEWSQCGPSFHVESMGPWFRHIPREMWLNVDHQAEGLVREEAMGEIEKDFINGSDERIELAFIGIGVDEAALGRALDSCLSTDEEMALDESLGTDEFGMDQWPKIDILVQEMREERRHFASETILEEVEVEEEEEEEEGLGQVDVVRVGADGGGDSDLCLVTWRPGRVYEVTLGAPEAQELLNQAEAALSSLSPPLSLTSVVDWHASWAVACKKDATRLEALAQRHSHVVFMRIRIPADERGPNAALAREKVMDRPFSRRTCNRPIPRSGGKWPVYTIHQGPTLHPYKATSQGDGQPWTENEKPDGGGGGEEESPMSRIESWLDQRAPKLAGHDDKALALICEAIKPSSVPVPPPRAPAGASATAVVPPGPGAGSAAKPGAAGAAGGVVVKGSGSIPRAIPKGWWSGAGGSKKGIIASRSRTQDPQHSNPAQVEEEDADEIDETDEGLSLSADERAMLKKLGLVKNLKRGAVEFKAHLHMTSSSTTHAVDEGHAVEGGEKGRSNLLVVAWVPSLYKESEKLARELDALTLEVWSTSPSTPDATDGSTNQAPIVLIADVSASSANTLLAKALLKQDDPESYLAESGPVFHLYSERKLSKVLKGGLKSIHRLQHAVREKIYDGAIPLRVMERGVDQEGGWVQSSSAFIINLAPPGCPYEPPLGKEAVAGAQRSFAKGVKAMASVGGPTVLGVFWPKMPCLSCGCPWWQGEDWDAKCVRCGWDCETDGYDDDSRPLPENRARFEAFSAAIKQGRVAEYHS